MSGTNKSNVNRAAQTGSDAVSLRVYLAFVVMVFGMFMAILDIQIVSASLSEIQAGLAASPDEASWVQTSYLIAEVIMIPLSGFLSRLLSTRVLFTYSVALFTIASGLCATATSIDQMIVYRALQGFVGGGMIPSVFTIAYTAFPVSKRGVVVPIVGLVATLAPTIGPTFGGYLSDTFSWHWLFLVNLPCGIIVAIAAWRLIDFDRPNFSLFKQFDWFGLSFMALFLGSLEYILEEGPRNDWLENGLIRYFTFIMAISAILFLVRAFTAKQPIVDLRAFSDVNFSLGSLFSLAMGIGIFGLTYVYPLFLSRVRGYDSLMIGETMFISGLAMFITAPVAGALSTRMDPRLMIGIGFFGFAFGTWIVTGITADWDFWELFWPQIFRGISLMFCMIPISNLALGTLSPELLKNASGLFNLTRNLGGAIGIAVINTVIMRRTDFHYARIAETLRWGDAQVDAALRGIAATFNVPGIDPQLSALQQLTSIVSLQATVMAFADTFYLLTILMVILLVLVCLVKKPKDAPSSK